MRAYLGHRPDGFFVEVGANDPTLLSQTWHLEQAGWRGLLVEPLPDCAARLREQRPASRVFEVACSAPDKVGQADFHVAGMFSSLKKFVDDLDVGYARTVTVRVMTLDQVLAEAGNPRVDFVAMDTEGTELDVLRGFTLEKHRPALLLIEDKVHTLDKHFHLRRHGYRLARRTGFNNWYVPAEAPRPAISAGERWNLVRKMYLGTPSRALRLWWKRWRSAPA